MTDGRALGSHPGTLYTLYSDRHDTQTHARSRLVGIFVVRPRVAYGRVIRARTLLVAVGGVACGAAMTNEL